MTSSNEDELPEYTEVDFKALSVEDQLSLSKLKMALTLFRENKISFERFVTILTTDKEISGLLQNMRNNKISMLDSILTIKNSQIGDINTRDIAGENIYNFSIHYHKTPNSSSSNTPKKSNNRPIAQRYTQETDPVTRQKSNNIIYVANVIDTHIDDIEQYVGAPNEMSVRPVGSGEEIPLGGATRRYDYQGYLLSINYDNKDIAKGVRIEGLEQEGYSIDSWFEILMRFGMSVRESPSDRSIIAVIWRNYLGYRISVAMNKVGGVINIVRIFKLPTE